MTGRTTFIVNPTSGSGRTRRRFERLTPLVLSHFENVDITFTKQRSHATELTRQAIKSGSKLIVAVGGDGTANEVVNGFFEDGALISPDVRLGVLMSGTGGDLRRSIGMPKDLKEGILRIKNGFPTPIDVGVVRCANESGTETKRFFLNAASLGLSALTALLVRDELGRQSRFAYVIAAIRAIGKTRAQTLNVVVDGEQRTLKDVSLLAFANAAYFGGAMHIAPGASLMDGKADVVAVSRVGYWMMARNIIRLYRGTHLNLKQVTHFKAMHLEVEAPEKTFLVETDGEPCGQLPATFEILKGAIELVR